MAGTALPANKWKYSARTTILTTRSGQYNPASYYSDARHECALLFARKLAAGVKLNRLAALRKNRESRWIARERSPLRASKRKYDKNKFHMMQFDQNVHKYHLAISIE